MKKPLLLLMGASFLLCSCGFLGIGGQRNGCPTNGKNIGAEKILAGDAKAIKAARKAGKFVKD